MFGNMTMQYFLNYYEQLFKMHYDMMSSEKLLKSRQKIQYELKVKSLEGRYSNLPSDLEMVYSLEQNVL